MYTPPNEYEPRVPSSLIKAVMAKKKKVEGAYIMLDLKYISPMTVMYVPSTVNFEKINIPSTIGLNELEII